MKNQILTLVFSGFCMLSCATENLSANNAEGMKTDPMLNFDKAMKSLTKPENQSSPEEKTGNGAVLNEKSKQILYLASKEFILSSGITQAELTAGTSDNREKTISLANRMYFEKYQNIQKQLKSEK